MPFRRVENPPNPWNSAHVEWLDAPPPVAQLEIYEEQAKTILSENDSPDVGFRFSLNPYRGCFHACAPYCYARPSHMYWDFGAGTDFERKLIVKTNAPQKLRETFLKPSWNGELIAFSGNTDCYQPLEAVYGLTRQCLEICRDFHNPVALITKSALVRRDAQLLGEIQRVAQATATVSIPFADSQMARQIEPNAPSPRARFEAVRALADAGVPVNVAIAPVIPGLNDSQIAEILERAREHGATRASHILLRLPLEVKDVLFARLAEAYPDRVNKVRNAMTEMHQGKLYNSQFGLRHSGVGERWEAIDWLFDLTCKRLGLNGDSNIRFPTPPKTFIRPPQPGAQLELFSDAPAIPPTGFRPAGRRRYENWPWARPRRTRVCITRSCAARCSSSAKMSGNAGSKRSFVERTHPDFFRREALAFFVAHKDQRDQFSEAAAARALQIGIVEKPGHQARDDRQNNALLAGTGGEADGRHEDH